MSRDYIGPRRRYKEDAKRASRESVQPGYLVDDYDGLSQYVQVDFSRNSSGSGFLARVAAGDFELCSSSQRVLLSHSTSTMVKLR